MAEHRKKRLLVKGIVDMHNSPVYWKFNTHTRTHNSLVNVKNEREREREIVCDVSTCVEMDKKKKKLKAVKSPSGTHLFSFFVFDGEKNNNTVE